MDRSLGLDFEPTSADCTEVHFASFLSGGFTTMAVVKERKLAKCTIMGECHTDVIVTGTLLRLDKAVMLGYQLHLGEQKLFTIIWNS